MPSISAANKTFPSSGKIISVTDGSVVFNPTGTSYELHLLTDQPGLPLNTPVKCLIRAEARKIYTVPSGGNFITPILGPPRIVQGLVRAVDEESIVVQAGASIIIKLPAEDHAIDLANGEIGIGGMVNVVCLPGARAEFLK